MKKLLLSSVMAILLVGSLAMGVMAEQAAVGFNYWHANNEIKTGSGSGDSSFRIFSFGGEMALADKWSAAFLFESGDGDDYDEDLKGLSVDLSTMQVGVKYAIQPGVTVNGGYLSTDLDIDGEDYSVSGLVAGLSFSLMVSDQIDFYGDFAYSPFLSMDGEGADDDASVTYVDLRGTYALPAFDIEAGYRLRSYKTEMFGQDTTFRFSGPYVGVSARF